MNIKEADLKRLRVSLESALSSYEPLTGIKFQDFPDIILTPEKPNSARTVIPVTYNAEKIGDLYAIVFVRGDGTGDSKTYKSTDLIVPQEYVHTEKAERVFPRAKTGIISEGCFPFFSMTSQGDIAMFAISLDELGIEGKTITPLWKLGMSNQDYSKALHGKLQANPQIYSTVGSINGQRVGDPHSIYYNRNSEDALQVVGFLGINNQNNPLAEISRNWILPTK